MQKMDILNENLERFFGTVHAQMSKALAGSEPVVNRFFDELTYKLITFRQQEKYFNRLMACKFNVFDYIYPNENDLSDILVDLLDPGGRHGQGPVFLMEFLKLISADERYDPGALKSLHRETLAMYSPVVLRRIDFTIDFGCVGIGIENKPWANEQDGQLDAYSDHLARKYGDDNFMLLYLSGDGTDPISLAPHKRIALSKKNQRYNQKVGK